MDKVQIYYTSLVALGFLSQMYIHGNPKTGIHDFRWYVVGMLISLPMIGRIYGWW